MSDIDIGRRLKSAREQAGWSQRALAKRAGITNSTISLIEANMMNPSVGALKRILDAIPVSLGAFFSADDPEEWKPFYRAADLVEIGKGAISYRQVGRSMSGTKLQMLSERYRPGSDTGRIPLSHDGEECGIVISGELEVTVDGKRQILGPGDAYSFESVRPHRFRCVGDKDALVISACTPPSF